MAKAKKVKKIAKKEKVCVYECGSPDPKVYLTPIGINTKIYMVDPKGQIPDIQLGGVQYIGFEEHVLSEQDEYGVKVIVPVLGEMVTVVFGDSVNLYKGCDLKLVSQPLVGHQIEMTIHGVTEWKRMSGISIDDLVTEEDIIFTATSITSWHEVK